MKEDILLSVVIPYYNSDTWIGKMLDSLLDQDLPDNAYEIIVIDDGSTQSVCNLMRYTEEYPDIIKYHRKQNGGMSDARNTGISMAEGKWIYMCDSDDFVQPQVFGTLINTARELDLDMLVCNWCMVQPDASFHDQEMPFKLSSVVTGKEYLASFSSYPMSIGFGVWRFFVKKRVITDNHIRFEDMRFMEDRLFQLDLLLVVNRVAHADVNLYYYVQHQSSITHKDRKREFTTFSTYVWHYIERLSDVINNDSSALDDKALTVLEGWRDMAVFSLLIASFRYCPVSITRFYLHQLPSIKGAYPVKVIGRRMSVRLVRWFMGHKGLWLFMCRVFHLIPLRIR